MIASILSNRALGGSNSLTFVTYQTSIAGGIDWHAVDKPRLWRYHLHYFDYLTDDARSERWKRNAVDDWIKNNPNPTNDAWEAYPLSLRIVNWVKYFERVDRPEGIQQNWLQSLYDQALWLESNLERRILANPYFKNAKAMVFAGTFFDGRDADRWLRKGLKIMLSETREQFLSDGGHYERSPMYHMICVEDLLDTLNVLSTAPGLVPQDVIDVFHRKATLGLAFLDAILMPDGEIPLFNDAVFGVGPAPHDLFTYGRSLVGYKRFTKTSKLAIQSLRASGYYVIRDGDDMLVMDCGLPGPSYQPGHAHSDCLSYELALGGQRIVVDTGVRDYDLSSTRKYARSTAAHNTITVDSRSQSEMWGAFRIGRRARPISPSLVTPNNGEALFIGAHDGFRRFRNRIIHRRQLSYQGRRWLFEDRVSGHGVHRVESRIHLAPGLVARYANGVVLVVGLEGRLRAKIIPSSKSSIEIAQGPYFPRFGVTETRNVIVMSVHDALPITLSYAIERSGAEHV